MRLIPFRHADRSLYGDERGSTLIELALLLPILVSLFLGSVELSTALRADRKMIATTQSLVDLITQASNLTDQEMTDVLNAAQMIMRPFPIDGTRLKIGVASVQFDADSGAPTVDWTESRNGGVVANATTKAAGMGIPGESVVLVHVEYTYTPVLGALFFQNGLTFRETATARPRKSAWITREN